MPTFKKLAATVALSTALTGGAVGLGASTTVTSANAGESATSVSACHGGCCRRCCGINGRRIHRTTIKIRHHIGVATWRNVRGCWKVFG